MDQTTLTQFNTLFKDYLPLGRSLLYAPRLCKSLEDVLPLLKQLSGIEPLEVLLELVKAWLRELDSLILPTIVHEIKIAKENAVLSGSNSEEMYKRFFRDAADNKIATTFAKLPDKYPLLIEYLKMFISSTISNLKTSLERFLKDSKELNRFGSLKAILPTDSDRHGNGQQVLIYEFDGGEKIVYKPFGGDSARMFMSYCKALGYPKTPRIVVPIDQALPQKYYWMEYVPHATCQSEQDVHQYFYNAGKLLCIAESLIMSDGHSGNLIASGMVPIVVDSETIFRPQLSRFQEELDTFEKRLKMTLLVQDPPVVGKQFDELHAAFQQHEEKKPISVLSYHATNDFTADLTLQSERNEIEINKAVPVFAGNVAFLYDNVDSFMEGFIEAKQFMQSNKDTFVGLLENIQTRVILRPTALYLNYLSALKQPCHLTSREAAEQFLRTSLTQHNVENAKNFANYDALLDSEVSQLLRLDVPAFYTYANDLSVYTNTDVIADDFFLGPTSLDRAKSLLNVPTAADLKILRELASTKAKMTFESDSFARFGVALASKVKRLEDSTIFRGEAGKLIIFATLASQGNVLGDAAKIFHNEAATLFDSLLTRLQNSDIQPDGAALGICSVLYALSFAAAMLDFPTNEIAQAALRVDETVGELDLLGGVAGAIICILAVESLVSNTPEGPLLLRKAERLTEAQMKQNSNWKKLTGASHGFSGLALTLHRLYIRTSCNKYLDFLIEMVKTEDKYYSQEFRNWLDMREDMNNYDWYTWCNGAPGIALVRNAIYSVLPDEMKRDWSVKATQIYDDILLKFEHTLSENHSVCCGSAGLIEAILSFKCITSNERAKQIDEKVSEMTRQLCEVILTKGAKVSDEGLFQGILGLAYSLLRAQGFPTCIVNWEMPTRVQA